MLNLKDFIEKFYFLKKKVENFLLYSKMGKISIRQRTTIDNVSKKIIRLVFILLKEIS